MAMHNLFRGLGGLGATAATVAWEYGKDNAFPFARNLGKNIGLHALSMLAPTLGTYAGYRILVATGLVNTMNVLKLIGLDEEGIKELFQTFRKELGYTILQLGGLMLALQITSLASSVLAAYAQAYLKYIIGRPKLSTEYQFDTWTNRIWNTGAGVYNFALESIFGKGPQKPHEVKAIFNADMEEQLHILKNGITNIRNHNGYFSNLLLYGPPGVGKTMVGRELAKAADMNFIVISGGGFAQFKSRGEHIKEVNDLFERVNNSDKPTVIFIDEVEGLARKRDDLDMEGIQLLNAVLNHTGSPSKKFLVVAATNRPQDIDSAFRGRCDDKLYVGPPGSDERMRMLKQYLPLFFGENCFNDPFTPKFLEVMNKRLEGFVGRDIFKVCNKMVITQAAEEDNTLTQMMALKTIDRFIENQHNMDDYSEEEQKFISNQGISIPPNEVRASKASSTGASAA